jgi:hypothetical protein
MEQKLIETMNKLTDAIQELNKTLSKPLEVNSEVYNTAVDLKHQLQDLKIAVDKLNITMSEE